jgi:hypothetical protein
MRYEMIRLAQLVFALSLMFGAFLGGLAVGWLRWGRRSEVPDEATRVVPRPQPAAPRVIKHDLFSPQFDQEPVVDVTTGPFSPAELRSASTASLVDGPPGAPRT